MQVFHTEDGCEADLEEAEGGAGGDLVWSRQEAWTDMCLQKAADFAVKSEVLHKQVESLEKKIRQQEKIRYEEEFMLERLVSQDTNNRYLSEKSSRGQPAAHHMGSVPPGATHGIQFSLIEPPSQHSSVSSLPGVHGRAANGTQYMLDSKPSHLQPKLNHPASLPVPLTGPSERRPVDSRDLCGVSGQWAAPPFSQMDTQGLASRPFSSKVLWKDNGALPGADTVSEKSVALFGPHAGGLRRDTPPCPDLPGTPLYAVNQMLRHNQSMGRGMSGMPLNTDRSRKQATYPNLEGNPPNVMLEAPVAKADVVDGTQWQKWRADNL